MGAHESHNSLWRRAATPPTFRAAGHQKRARKAAQAKEAAVRFADGELLPNFEDELMADRLAEWNKATGNKARPKPVTDTERR